MTVYREEEYIRRNTKGMTSEDARKFALDHHGLIDIETVAQLQPDLKAEKLPFR